MKRFFNRRRDALIASAVVATLAGTGLAYAHMQGGGPGGPDFGRGHQCGFGQQQQHGRGWSRAGKHVDGKLAFLNAELKITKDQETAWKDFSNVMRELDKGRAQTHETMRESFEKGQDASVVERINRRVAMMENGIARMKKLSGAVKKLYQVLTPEQQKLANELFPFHRGHHG